MSQVAPSKAAPSAAPRRATKLALVLDLDHTLVHTVPKSSFRQPLDVGTFNKDGERDLYEFAQPHNLNTGRPGDRLYVKLRPGVRMMLQKLRPFYSMWVFSMGSREYVNFVLTCLDPDMAMLPRRQVFCREDVNHRGKKHLTAVLQAHSIDRILVLDDKTDIWEHVPGESYARAFEYTFLTKLIQQPMCGDNDAHIPAMTRMLQTAAKDTKSGRYTSLMESIRGFWSTVLTDIRMLIIESGDAAARSAEMFGAVMQTEVDAGLHIVVVQDDTKEGAADLIAEAEDLGVTVAHGMWLTFCYATLQLQDPAPFSWQAQTAPADMWDAYTSWERTMNVGLHPRCASAAKPEVRQRLENASRARQEMLDGDE